MTSRFISQGMEKTDAKFVVAKMAQYEGLFVNLMVTEEWGLQLPEDDDAKLLTDAFIMAIAFAVFGCIPLLAYCFSPWSVMDDLSTFYAAAIIAGVLIFFLGSMKCSFCTVFWIYSGLETIFVAGAASGLAYLLGSIAANGF
jgi:vacuolar iron transporter family protein